MALALALAACGGPTGVKSITSVDGALRLQVPESWFPETDLNEVAAIQAGDRAKEAYAIVIEDPREPFQPMDLGTFADTQIKDLASTVGLANLSGPKLVVVNGTDAIQYRLQGFYNSVEVVYLYTFVETADRYLKVITWSLADKFEENREELESVASSIRQLEPLRSSPTPAPSPTVTGGPPPIAPTQGDDPDVIR